LAARQRRFRHGGVLTAGGIAGSAVGVAVFSLLQRIGQVDLAIGMS
jgi:hypothetical protein